MRLFELASYRSREIYRIDEGAEKVIEHLVKIWLFPRYKDVEVWIKHARKALYYTIKLKNGKFLSKDIIFKNSFEDHEFQIQFFQEEFIEDHEKYGEYPGYIREDARDLKKLTICVRYYFDGLSELLSKKGNAQRSEIDRLIVNSGMLDI